MMSSTSTNSLSVQYRRAAQKLGKFCDLVDAQAATTFVRESRPNSQRAEHDKAIDPARSAARDVHPSRRQDGRHAAQ